ncbi:glycosyltransferase family 1 protein [Candidatus Woesearchaeota archaeon]|nr:MAG: glycosyltransferase family 1 protein [Candidatus Woesearchaeota archaeon]
MLGWEFPPYFAGGVGIVCYELTKALAKHGVTVTYIMPRGPEHVHANHCELLVADNLILDKRVTVARIDSLLEAYTGYDEYGRRLSTLLKHGRGSAGKLYGENLLQEIHLFAEKVKLLVTELGMDFDVIHAHDWTTFPAAMALKELTGKPLIVHVHITEFDKTGGEHADPRIYAIERAGMLAADRVIAVSNMIRKRCIYQYHVPPDKIRIVYNAVEFNRRPGLPEEFPIRKQDRVVLFLGRITLQKGPDYFMEAAKKVLEMNPNVKFVMAGTGDMLPRMIERAAELGIGDKFIFPGFVNREQGDKLYRMADVFVMPSVSEPFGIVPLEAMYQGTPVIISRQSGISEVLKHALKVDFWDVNDIANKIMAALSYRTLHRELTDRGNQEVMGFNWEKPATEVEHIYEEVVNG